MKRGLLYGVVLVTLATAALHADDAPSDEVVIQNRGQQTFYYALRTQDGAGWSRTYEIAPGQQQTHAAPSGRLRISYLTETAQFSWLEAKQTYRIDNVVAGQLQAVRQVRRPSSNANASDPNASDPNASDPDADVTDSTDSDSTGSGESPGISEAELPAPSAAEPATAEPAGDATPDDAPAIDMPADDSDSSPTAPGATTDQADQAPSLAPAADRAEDAFEGLFDITNRVVTVRVVADNTYRNTFPQWRQRAQQIVEGASDYYRREYSIRLVVTETREWDYDGVSVDLETRWNKLLELSPRKVDLIVALVGYGDYSSVQGTAAFTGQLGRAAFFGQHLMVADRRDYHENRAKTVLIHELGHVFGAFHVDDDTLMMYPGYLELPTDEIIEGTVPFGETMDKVFRMTKEFDFREGVTSLSPTIQQHIQALYRTHGLRSESSRTDPITAGYQYLEQRAKIVAAQMAARAEAARGAFDGSAE